MPRRDIKPRLHAKYGARQEPSHRDHSGAQGRCCSQAILLSSSGSHSVRDRSRVHPAGCLGRSLASWHRWTTAGSTAADLRSRPMRVPECKRRRQHSCMGHAGRAEEVWLPLVAFSLSPSRFGLRRSAPGRPDSTFWTRIRSAHESRSSSSAREPASWAWRRSAALSSSSRAVLDQLKPRLLHSTRIAARGRHATWRASKTRARELASFVVTKTTSATLTKVR